MEKTFWGSKRPQGTRVQSRRLGQNPQVQKYFRQGLRAKFHQRSFQSQKRSQGRPQHVRFGRPRRGTDHRKILRTGAFKNKRWLTQTQEIELRELEESNLEEDENEDEETNLDEDDENLEWDDSILVPSSLQGFSPDPYLGPQ